MFKQKELPSFIDLMKEAWAYYLSNFKTLMKLMFMIIPVILLFFMGIGSFVIFLRLVIMTNQSTMNVVLAWSLGLIAFAFSVAAVIYAIILSLKLQTALTWVSLKKDTKKSFKELWAIGHDKYKDFFNTTILAGLMTLGWFLLLIIPGIFFGLMYAFAGWVCLDKGKTGREAIAESKSLVQGRWWQVFGKIFALQVLYLAAIFIVAALLGGKPWNEDDPVYSGVNSLASFILAPFFLAYTSSLYHALKKSK